MGGSAEGLAVGGEGVAVDREGLVDRLVGGPVAVFAFELAVEPAGEIAKGMGDATRASAAWNGAISKATLSSNSRLRSASRLLHAPW